LYNKHFEKKIKFGFYFIIGVLFIVFAYYLSISGPIFAKSYFAQNNYRDTENKINTTNNPELNCNYTKSDLNHILGKTNQDNNLNIFFAGYSNSYFELGIQYPYNWKKFDQDTGVTFYLPSDNNSKIVQQIFSINIKPSNNILQNNECKTIEELINYSTNFHLIGSNQVTIDGNKGYALLYTYTLKGTLLKEFDIIIPGVKNIYLLSYIAEPDQFSKFSPTLIQMIESFSFNAYNQGISQQNNANQFAITCTAANLCDNTGASANGGPANCYGLCDYYSAPVTILNSTSNAATVKNETISHSTQSISIKSSLDDISIPKSPLLILFNFTNK
jgi:hypothetical protein